MEGEKVSTPKAQQKTETVKTEPVAADPVRPAGQCVVDDGTPHTGRAVNGMVCSRHAMRYRADGTLRG